MTRPGRYPAEIRERAVRLVREHEGEYPSQWVSRAKRHDWIDGTAEPADIKSLDISSARPTGPGRLSCV